MSLLFQYSFLLIFFLFVNSGKSIINDDKSQNQTIDKVKGIPQTDPFNELDPEESIRRLSIVVKSIDKTKDGYISKDELIFWIKENLKKNDEEKTLAKIKQVDLDKNGNISWQEHVKKTYGLDNKELDKVLKTGREEHSDLFQSLQLDKKKFRLADLDGNGLLNISEYKLFLFPEHYLEMASIEIERTLTDFDHNKDGQIDFTEFLSHDSLNNETITLEKQHFSEYDSNSDGFLKDSELLKLAIPGFDHIAQGEAALLFNECDENKDERLSVEEIIRMHGLWVSSQATNFGDMLHVSFKDEL